MNVRELINELSKHDLDMLVLVDGYEEGYDDIKRCEVKNVAMLPKHPYYIGAYTDDLENVHEGDQTAMCLRR